MERIPIGTELKLSLHLPPIGSLHLEDLSQFECLVQIDGARPFLCLNKEDLIKVDRDNYLLIIPTERLARGKVKVRTTCLIPDEDCPDGYRTEVNWCETDIQIV